MGIFSRVRDIINSNINAMLDKAEDPYKLIRLIIREMEDALVELRTAAATAVAQQKKISRELTSARKRAGEWEDRAHLAIEKKRDDLAREALREKRRYLEQADTLAGDLEYFDNVVSEYKSDIRQLEEKLASVRKRQRVLIQRRVRAEQHRAVQKKIHKVDTSDVFARVEAFENRIDRIEAEADLVNYGRTPPLEEEFARLERDEAIEKELEAMKNKSGRDDVVIEESGDSKKKK